MSKWFEQILQKSFEIVEAVWDWLIWDNPLSAWIARNVTKRTKP